jgi:hypothetical protein
MRAPRPPRHKTSPRQKGTVRHLRSDDWISPQHVVPLHIVVDHWPIDLARFVAGSGGLRMSPGKRAPGKHDESGTDQNKFDHGTHSSSPHSRTQWPALMRLHVASRPQDVCKLLHIPSVF